MPIKPLSFALLSLAIAFAPNSQLEADLLLTTNGDFESGDTTGWTSFAMGSQTFDVTNDAANGSSAGLLTNLIDGQPLVVKQANLGVGVVVVGETVSISFDAKGEGVLGGVAFAEFFSEIDGGGTSSAEILGGGPLALTNTYQTFNFTATTGTDISGGVTLQFNAATGANIGSTSTLFIDNVSVSVVRAVPEPGSAIVIGLVAIGILSNRRRPSRTS